LKEKKLEDGLKKKEKKKGPTMQVTLEIS